MLCVLQILLLGMMNALLVHFFGYILYVCLPLLSRSYVFLYCCWRLWKHKTVCRSYTSCNIDSRAPARESMLRQPQALQQVMWRPGPGQQSQCLQVCHPTRTGTTLSWQAQLLPWVAWVGIYCQSLRSRRRLWTEEGGLWMRSADGRPYISPWFTFCA